jgi:hypothetical protein
MRVVILLLLGLVACKRPVDRPFGDGATLVTDVRVDPAFVRANVPFEISFVASGKPPASVTYDIAGEVRTCEPERRGERVVCVHPGFGRDAIESGPQFVAVEARDDDDNSSTGTAQFTVDFDCPSFIALTLVPPISEPDRSVLLTIEANESLGEPPRVTRNGIDWGAPVGSGSSYTLTHMVTLEDPAQESNVSVRLTDRAGNTTDDCNGDGAVPFAVDHTAPITSIAGIVLDRDAPGRPAVISAMKGSFQDDVGIDEVRILDETGERLIATLVPDADGGLQASGLGTTTDTRVQVEAVDRFGRTSPRTSISERWRLSIGSGNTPGAAVRTAVRYTPAPPNTTSMRNRTVELAADVFQEDTRSAIIRAHVGFEKVGDLPTRYEGVSNIVAGYEPVGRSVIGVGGYDGTTFNFYAEYVDDVIVLRWDEREGMYVTEQGPALSYVDPLLPDPRYGINLAFDGSGCGVMVGGDARVAIDDARTGADVWRLCYQGGVYEWSQVNLQPFVEGNELFLFYPIIWDPLNLRYVVVGGDKVLYLQPGATLDDWSWINVTPLPQAYGERVRHFLYWDPRVEGYAVGLGGVFSNVPGGFRLLWTHRGGQWSASEVPFELGYRSRFGWAYDEARRRLVIWGGNDQPDLLPEEQVRYLVGSSTSGVEAWRSSEIDHPVARDYPSMVYDSDREVVVVFGGIRPQDMRPVPAEVHQIISEPSYPYLQASIDLAAQRPKGIDALNLTVRALGLGDRDGTNAGIDRFGGVVVSLWDHAARRWVEVASSSVEPNTDVAELSVEVREEPERFVSNDGTVPITVQPRYATTEAVDGRLEVDLIDGYLQLRGGITLP